MINSLVSSLLFTISTLTTNFTYVFTFVVTMVDKFLHHIAYTELLIDISELFGMMVVLLVLSISSSATTGYTQGITKTSSSKSSHNQFLTTLSYKNMTTLL